MKLSKNKWRNKDTTDDVIVELTYYSPMLDFVEFIDDNGNTRMLPREVFMKEYYELV